MNKIITIELYDRDVMVHFGSRKELRKKLGRMFDKETAKEISGHFSDVSLGRTIILDGGQIILFIPHMPSTVSDYAVLQHEIFHATFFILEKAGIVLCEKSDEAYSYLIQFLTKRILEEFTLSFSSGVRSA